MNRRSEGEIRRRIEWLSARLPPEYEVLEFLGRGGFGQVFRVRHRPLDRIEALKVIQFDHPDQPAERLRGDFLREARLMDRLASLSRYIIRVFHIGHLPGSPAAGYFTMEFVEGGDLKDEVTSRGPMELDRAVRLVRQVCETMEQAHELHVGEEVGVLHRDLKLENVMRVGSAGEEEVRILDFGLAKVLAETGSTDTYALGARATRGCAPPEQLLGERLGPAADLFAVGVMLYELVTGHEPWTGKELPGRITRQETVSLFIRSTELKPIPPRRFRSEVPGWLEEAILDCLRFGPGERIGSAAELLARLAPPAPGRSRSRQAPLEQKAGKVQDGGGEGSEEQLLDMNVPETEVVPPGPGSVHVTSDPERIPFALLRDEDGTVLEEGVTPCTMSGLAPGAYRAVVRSWKYRPTPCSVTIEPRGQARVDLVLDRYPWTRLPAHPVVAALGVVVLLAGVLLHVSSRPSSSSGPFRPSANLVAAGSWHACVLDPSSTAHCWGSNHAGQLGDGTRNDRATPTRVVGDLRFASLSAGDRHTCGLTKEGAGFCWGANESGQLGDDTTTERVEPTRVVGGLRFSSLTAGGSHTCGLTLEGAAWCWGHNEHAELGDGTRSDRFRPVGVGIRLSRRRPGLSHRFAALTAAGWHTCALTAEGIAWCWGDNSTGRLGTGTRVDEVTPMWVAGDLRFASLTAGDGHTCGVTKEGAAFCWGANEFGQLGNGTTTSTTTPEPVMGGIEFVSLTSGDRHTCGLAETGSAYCWGDNSGGQLGNGTTENQLLPAPVVPVGRFVSLSSRAAFTCAVTSGGSTFCWGTPDEGGTTTPMPLLVHHMWGR